MSGALILVLPGVLCAVMAWDLFRPTPARLRERAAAAVLAACSGSCLLAALWSSAETRGPAVLATLYLLVAVARSRRDRARLITAPDSPAYQHDIPPTSATAARAEELA